jgi:hypothetical protein
MKKIAAALIIILGLYMLYLGIPSNMRPPMVTGVGFILIGLVWLFPNKS